MTTTEPVTEVYDVELIACPTPGCHPRLIWDRTTAGDTCAQCGAAGQPVPKRAPEAPAAAHEPTVRDALRLRFRQGGSFILDTPPDPTPVWGRGREVLWAEGEALTIVGGQGVGKTTLAQQLALGRCGLPEYAEVLGYPVDCPGGFGTVLYMAMDRPRQAARSFRRMVGEAMRGDLDDALQIWEGPPIVDIAKNPSTLVQYAVSSASRTIVVDSIKDAALKLSDDEVGGGWNRARQMALREGIEIIEVHHNRKAVSGVKNEHPSIDDVYGSTWITSGAGSVLLLTGRPGDPIVNLHHLKQPSEEVGPLKVIHDHDSGRSSIWHSVDIFALASSTAGGITAAQAAEAMFDTEKPTSAEREKARRKLDRLANQGLLRVLEAGGRASQQATRWGV